MTAGIDIAISLGVAAAVEDLRRRSVPNWLTASGAAGGLVYAACGGWHGLKLAAAGMLLGFLILMPFHWCGAMGGGDVKLMAAYGTLLGPTGILLAAVFAAVIGGLSAAGTLLCNPRARAIAFAPAIVLGAWVTLVGGS